MASGTSARHGARKFGHAVSIAARNGRKTSELAVAAGHVVAKRTALGAEAIIDPLNADLVEFARIIPEKVMAFSAMGMSWLHWSGEITGHMAGLAAREMAHVAEAAVATASCRTPEGLIAAQSSIAAAWVARAWSHSMTLGSLVMRSHGAAMAPVHRAATANARRLGR
jgi:hypothetical protein